MYNTYVKSNPIIISKLHPHWHGSPPFNLDVKVREEQDPYRDKIQNTNQKVNTINKIDW